MFSAERVLDVVGRVSGAVVDGGWGIDALLGMQTRDHDDLDLIVPLESCDQVVRDLSTSGFAVALDERPTRVVLDDGASRLDLHLVSPAEFGMSQSLPGDRRFTYALDGTVGTISGSSVQCLSVPMQILTHCGYEPDEGDRADMAAIADRFGESLPPPYCALDDLELRTATLRDVAALVVVRQRSWSAAYTGRIPQGVIDAIDLGASWMSWSTAIRVPPLPSLRVTVAGPVGEVHGFSVVSACRDDDATDVGELRLLYVDPSAWSRGVGAALLQHAVQTLRSMGFGELRLWTLRENERARSFYERFGWRADGAEQVVDEPQGSYAEVRYRLVG